MHHGSKTASRAGAPKKLFAGIAALGLAAGAYGVYATTLSVSGTAGTNLQAGTDTSLPTTTSCVTGGALEVRENYTDGALNSTNGYTPVNRTSFNIKMGTGTSITAGTGCGDLTVRVAVKIASGGVGAGVFTELTGTTTLAAIRDAEGNVGVNLDDVTATENWGLDTATTSQPIAAEAYSIRIGS